MLTSYAVTGFRHIRRSKVNFAFKTGGLSLALCCMMAIAVYVSHQRSFDKHHDDYERIYRVGSHRKDNGALEKYAIVPRAVGPLLQQHPDVATSSRLTQGGHTYVRFEGKVLDCESIVEADSTIFEVLTFRFVDGNKRALIKPNGIVLTRSFAMRLFGTTDVLGRVVTLNADSELFEVTAVIEDMPANSHLYLEAMTRIRTEHNFTDRSIADPVAFSDESSSLYIKLRSSGEEFPAQANALLARYVTKEVSRTHGFGIFLQPLADIHLDAAFLYDGARHGSMTHLYTFAMLGVLLLLVAGINYVNLSIADFAGRSRETGVRKVLGARPGQLVLQVVVEATCICLLSLAIAMGLLYASFPAISQMLDPDLHFEMVWHRTTVGIIVASIVVFLLLACALPAQQLRSMRVVHNLQMLGAGYNAPASRALLFTQFAVSVLCIFCTLAVAKQVNFMHHKDLGFDREKLLVLSMPTEFTVQKLQTFKTELKRIPGITAVSNSSFRIGNGYWKDWYFVEDGAQVKEIELYEVFSDDELFTTLGISVLKGRTFSSQIPTDSGAAFVINETAAHVLGWDNPIGKRIYTHPEENGKWDGTVVGVVSDINISPLYARVQPLVMRLPWQSAYPDAFVYVRYSGVASEIVDAIGDRYKMVMPGYPLAWREVDELFNNAHQREERAFASLKFGTVAILLVSLSGIFSMAAFMSMKRMKEFGIRKVLGASLTQIASLHLQYFLRIALLANLLALPVAYWVMDEWMTTFAYRTNITADLFLIVGGGSIMLILLSGAYSALKSATVNPVQVIKSE